MLWASTLVKQPQMFSFMVYIYKLVSLYKQSLRFPMEFKHNVWRGFYHLFQCPKFKYQIWLSFIFAKDRSGYCAFCLQRNATKISFSSVEPKKYSSLFLESVWKAAAKLYFFFIFYFFHFCWVQFNMTIKFYLLCEFAHPVIL